MKIKSITHHYLYKDSLFPIQQKIVTPIYATIPDILEHSTKVVYIQKDDLLWFKSNSIIQLYTENIKLKMIALISNSQEECKKIPDEYDNFITGNHLFLINKLNDLYHK